MQAIRSQLRWPWLSFFILLMLTPLAPGMPTIAAPALQVAPNETTFLYLPTISRNYTGLSGRIVFETDRDGNLELYRLNAAGLDAVRLTNNGAIDRNAVWSPDGARIAFMSNYDGNYEIYVMNADGTGKANLTQ